LGSAYGVGSDGVSLDYNFYWLLAVAYYLFFYLLRFFFGMFLNLKLIKLHKNIFDA